MQSSSFESDAVWCSPAFLLFCTLYMRACCTICYIRPATLTRLDLQDSKAAQQAEAASGPAEQLHAPASASEPMAESSAASASTRPADQPAPAACPPEPVAVISKAQGSAEQSSSQPAESGPPASISEPEAAVAQLADSFAAQASLQPAGSAAGATVLPAPKRQGKGKRRHTSASGTSALAALPAMQASCASADTKVCRCGWLPLLPLVLSLNSCVVQGQDETGADCIICMDGPRCAVHTVRALQSCPG